MSFCTSLRRRQSCSSLVPVLQARPLSLRENALDTHDIVLRIHLPPPENKVQDLRFLVVTPSSVVPANKDVTMARVQRYAGLSGSKYCGIIFYLCPLPEDAVSPSPLHALNDFQIQLMQSRINVPLLPLSDASGLPVILSAFAKPFTMKSPRSGAKSINAALNILPYCTTDTPMRQEMLVALTDQTTCLKDVACLRDKDVPKLVEGGMSERDVDAILGFWAKEWVVD